MFCLMLLLFGAVVFISGTDPKKLTLIPQHYYKIFFLST